MTGASADPVASSGQAAGLLARVRAEAAASDELVRLVLAGVSEIDTRLIVDHLLPQLLPEHGMLHFRRRIEAAEILHARLLPMADGSALAQHARGDWLALDPAAAEQAITYLGLRHAPGDHWNGDFAAWLDSAGEEGAPLSPQAVADYWQRVTGQRPRGFATGLLDELEAWGEAAYSAALGVGGKLGL